jgi:hypothetical protein
MQRLPYRLTFQARRLHAFRVLAIKNRWRGAFSKSFEPGKETIKEA